MVALEAWALGRPVLANAQVRRAARPVHPQQRRAVLRELRRVRRSAARARRHRGRCRRVLGANGREYFRRHYAWPVIERKYLDMLDRLEATTATAAAAALEPLPGWLRAAAATLPPALTVVAALPAGAVVPRPHRRSRSIGAAPDMPATRSAVHQVLATLGYGDAIGHEVLGIQRVLRAAGYESEIFVETADPRLERLTVDYRELVDASRPDDILIHHFSIGSRASRMAYALPDRMMLVYHNITPPEYFLGVHPLLVQQCYHGPPRARCLSRRACDLALGDSEFNRAGARGAGLRADRRAAGRARLRASGRRARSACIADDFDDDWTNMLFVGRVIPNKRLDDVIRFFHAYKTLLQSAVAAAPRRLATAASRATSRCCSSWSRRSACSDVHFLGQVSERRADGALRRRRPVPLRERARGLLRAARRGVLQARAGAGLRGHGGAGDDGRRRRAVRHAGSAATSRR